MNDLNRKQELFLKEHFGERVSFDPVERKLYSHDIAAMPGIMKPFTGRTIPLAVVQPVDENELQKIVRWANVENIAIFPRGRATSGYGGVVPVERGIVVDFYRMRSVIEVDKQRKLVSVEPGITWEQLDRRLGRLNLTLRLYPTSYPSSSVGGWLAHGGSGIGGYEYGYFRENVSAARVVLADGEVREFKGSADLDLISDAMGVTGLISKVVVAVKELEEIKVKSIACPHGYEFQKLMAEVVESGIPVWSVMFINPRMAELKNRAPLLMHHDHPAEERVLLPASYIMTISYRAKDEQVIWAALEQAVKNCEAEILSDRIANHEWENRFKLMVVKRLGPSLVPAEVVVPLSSLGNVLAEIEHTVDQPIIKEGILIKRGAGGKPEVVILGFIPADQRRFGYNFVFGLSLSVMKIAEKHGGRPYATGLYFTGKAKRILGNDRVERIKTFKKKHDPLDIMNPGKVVANALPGTLVRFSAFAEPLLRRLGNSVITQIGENPHAPVKNIPSDVAWYAYSCSQCGYCIDECDQFYGRGWESQSPRGKWYWLREFMEGREEWDQKMVDTFLVCTTCELCNFRCSAALPIEPSWMKLRGQLINEDKKMTFPPFEMMAQALDDQGNIWAGYRKDRSSWFPEDLLKKHGMDRKSEVVYFAGCTASYVEKDIAIASVRLLDRAGVDFMYLGNRENCCATPMLVAGKWNLFEDTIKKNINAVKEAGADTVVTSCPACDMMWRHTYPSWAQKLGIKYEIQTFHYSEIISEKINKGEFRFPENGKVKSRVTWHDSCHIGRVSGIYEPPRDLIKAVPGAELVEMSHNRQEGHCCGSVLTLIKEPPVAAEIGNIRLKEAMEAHAQKILALCPCCEFQLRVSAEKREIPIEVVDLARFAASALGYEFPDPNPEVKTQWAVFAAMIELMTPQGFAALMGTMWQELVAAMPFGMGTMMRLMGKIPGALNLMKPMFPVLFPKLLPLMMPKVMPVMLTRVEERIPMPVYMREQMPGLMPRVMDNLMPHMIGDVVPLVTDPLIRYLQGKSN